MFYYSGVRFIAASEDGLERRPARRSRPRRACASAARRLGRRRPSLLPGRLPPCQPLRSRSDQKPPPLFPGASHACCTSGRGSARKGRPPSPPPRTNFLGKGGPKRTSESRRSPRICAQMASGQQNFLNNSHSDIYSTTRSTATVDPKWWTLFKTNPNCFEKF